MPQYVLTYVMMENTEAETLVKLRESVTARYGHKLVEIVPVTKNGTTRSFILVFEEMAEPA